LLLDSQFDEGNFQIPANTICAKEEIFEACDEGICWALLNAGLLVFRNRSGIEG